MLYGIAAVTASFATAAASFLLAALLAALLRVLALRLGLVDRRRLRPVPLLGGVAVVLVTGLVVWAGDRTGVVPLGPGVGRLLVAGTAVGALGLAADVWRLRRRWLVAGTAVAAACVVPYDGEGGAVAGVLAVVWIVAVAAAFRGLDHADGVAGTVGVVTAFGIAACAVAELMDGLAVLLSALAAALAGFLLHNRYPARIALGACGSLFAGFLLAGAAVFTRTGHDPRAGVGVLFALTVPVVADALLVLLSRLLAGRPLLRGGPDHLAHRLRRLGLTPQGAVVVLGATSFGGVLAGVLVHVGWARETTPLWVAGGVSVGVAALLRVRVYEPRRAGTDARAARGPRSGANRHVRRGIRTAAAGRVGRDLRAGMDGRVGRDPRAGMDGRVGRDPRAGMDGRVGRDPRAGMDGRMDRVSRAGVDTGMVRGVRAGADDGMVRGSRTGPDTRAPQGPRTGPDTRAPQGPRTGPDTRAPQGPQTGADARVRQLRAQPQEPSREVPESAGVPVRAPSRAGIFPVRQARSAENAQVSASLRVRNG
ncbi:undecaprenyl/decaprenyl-phosphate alpha-N-acetylglucosaminyl 1-phosphate transferase [Streptomyces sp. AC627_RSS907]|uniref:undecaprenyl/decaprenyl-phosphate alpha-N-acetylglucosaminyl 1-phosphate transferase n=1 Tax=Streptomyces sp. AC627_RSS907 TaxID=2823684 RepID=UPI0035B39175